MRLGVVGRGLNFLDPPVARPGGNFVPFSSSLIVFWTQFKVGYINLVWGKTFQK